MSTDLFDRFGVIDVDTHLTEPPDMWTARVPSSMHDVVPHIERIDGRDVWMADGERLGPPGFYSMAGFDGVLPVSIPKTYDEIPGAMYDADARLAFLDGEGIQAQVLYPNVGGFGNGYFLRLGDPELVAQCVHAYNDFLTDWCSAAPDRLLAITALPFWDVDLAVGELHRCIELGHRAVNFCNQPQDYGQPPLAHPHWDPIWAAAQEAGVSVSFHVGGGSMGTQFGDVAGMGWMTNFAKVSSLIFLDNIRCVADLIFGGVCHRFPDLKLVSVESGVGWIPATLETFDWQWRNGGVLDEHPEYDLLPSEYFRRQIYGCFWFEARARSTPSRSTPTTSSSRPTTRTRRASTRAAHARPTPARLRAGAARRTARRRRAQGAARQRGRGLRRQVTEMDAPDLGSKYLVAHVDGRVLHLRIDRLEKRNAFTQDMYRGLKRAAIWADGQPELDAVCLTGTDDWFGAGGDIAGYAEDPEGLAVEWDATDHFPFRHIERCRSCGWPRSTACASPAVSFSRCTATSRSPPTGPASGCPSCCAASPTRSCRRASSTSSAWPGPATSSSPPPRSTPPRRARWASSARSCPTTSSTPAPRGSSSRSAAPARSPAPR